MCDMSLGGYPAGAQYDSRAPWNQDPGRCCDRCGGSGKIYWAWNYVTGDNKEVSEEEYDKMLDDDLEAEKQGEQWIRCDEEWCPDCHGEGCLYESSDYEDDYCIYDL